MTPFEESGLITFRHCQVPGDAVAAMRAAGASRKGVLFGPEARGPFNATLEAGTPPPENVRYQRDLVCGVPGWWCRPAEASPGAALLYFHGGCYVLGSATALRNYAGHLAVRSGADAFVPDYRLAPEHPFPAAIDDAVAIYERLTERADRILLAGDSAGGGLVLALLSILARGEALQQPVGAAVLSPWTDLAPTGESLRSRAEADPLFTRAVLQHFVDLYLNGADATDPRASPLYGAPPPTVPPIRIDVGDAEVMLEDNLRYADTMTAAGHPVDLNVWEGMPHVFPSALGRLAAAEDATDEIGGFLRTCLTPDS
jgi:monoterpene epsilon-lactone hydrolase